MVLNSTAMQSPSKSNNDDIILRNASESYLLVFEEGQYKLSTDALEAHADEKDLKRKRFGWPGIKFISLTDGMLDIVAASNNESYNIAMQVEKDMLQITCNCNTLVHKLCVHAYQTIYKLIFYKGENVFEQFSRGGLIEQALAFKQYFSIEESSEGISITPKAGIGKLFSTSEHITQALTNFLSLGIPPAVMHTTEADNNNVLGYALVYSDRKYHLPILLPFIGKTNKDGTTIRSFTDFIRKESDLLHLKCTEQQKLLNSICIDIYKTVQELPSTILSNPDALPGFVSLYHLWQQALPLVAKEAFVFRYYSYRLKFLLKKPYKQYMRSCTLHQEKPAISFTLSEKEDFYVLKLDVTINKKIIKRKYYSNAFLLLKQQDKEDFYFLSHLTDAAILEYFKESTDITIFKQQFKAFRDGFLKVLSERYPLTYLNANKEAATIKTIELKPKQKIVRMHTFEQWILIYLFVEYDDGNRLNTLLDGTGWFAEINSKQAFLQRDKQYETSFKNYIQSLHPNFSNQLPADCFYLSLSTYVKDNWLNEVQAKLTDCKVEYKIGK